MKTTLKKTTMTFSKIVFTIAILTVTQTKAADSKSADSSTGSDKVDLQKLEDQYWGAKDDDYGVIQNRTYAKAKKFYGSLSYGTLINDPFATAKLYTLAGGYYFNEDYGVELSYNKYNSDKNSSVSKFKSLGATLSPDYDLIRNSWTLSGTYTPFYAKMTFMNKKILYFDMGFSLGVGQSTYDQVQKADPNNTNDTSEKFTSKSAMHYELGFMQQLFINKNLAFRLDIKNTFYTQKVAPYRVSSTTTSSETSNSANDTTISFGFTLFSN